MRALRLTVLGAGGRLGRAIVRLALSTPEIDTVVPVLRPGSPGLEIDLGELVGVSRLGRRAVAGVERGLDEPTDAVIDVTGPEVVTEHAALCAERGLPLVVGVTGLSPDGRTALMRAGARIPVVWAPNFSVGAAALRMAARTVAAVLGEGFDAEVVELHHRRKRDAPSGTALHLAEALVGTGSIRSGREGLVGERPLGEIGVHAVRGGDVVGDHTVMLLGDGERLELTHRVTSRDVFARGALRAATWAGGQGRAPGFYGIEDALEVGT